MKSVRVLLIFLIVCVAGAVIATWPLLPNISSRLVLTHHNYGTDMMGDLWKIRYYKTRGFSDLLRNPRLLWHTPHLFAPWGMNLYVLEPHYFHASFTPLVWFWYLPFPTDYNLLLLLAIVTNGLALALAIRVLIKDTRAALIGGLVLVVAPYILTDLLAGRIPQGFLWTLPLFMLFYQAWILKGGRKNLILSSFFLALSSFSYLFYGLFMGLAMGIHVLVSLLFQRQQRITVLKRFLMVVVISGVLVLPVIYPFLHEAGTRESVQGVNTGRLIPFHLPPDLETPDIEIVPAPAVLGENIFHPVGVFSLLLTVPLLIYIRRTRKDPEERIERRMGLTFLGFALFFLALVPGPYLTVPGSQARLPTLFSLLYVLTPGFNRITTTARFLPVALVFLGLAVGYAVKILLKRLPGEKSRWIFTGAIILALLSLTRFSVTMILKDPPAVPPSIRSLAGAAPGGVIDMPILSERAGAEAMWFQTVHMNPILTDNNMRYESTRPAEFNRMVKTNPFVRTLDLLSGPDLIAPETVSLRGLEFFRKHNFKYIVVHKNALAGDEEEYRSKTPHGRRRRHSKISANLETLLGKTLYSDPVVDVFDLSVLYR